MNPIHESGFASLMVLFFATGPAALASLITLILMWKRPKQAIIAANVAIILASLVCLLAAVTTSKLHGRVDYWIDTGGYGPPADVRAKYGAEWHDSARITAWAGLIFTALPFTISAIAHVFAWRKNPQIEASLIVPVLGALAVLSCFMMAIL